MVYGQNLTDPGMDSNGSGKSGLIEGITLAITGKTCRDVSREEFVNIDEDFTFVELSLENKITKVNNLVIKRWIDKKKSARIEIWENNELNKEITSVNEANSRIFELIGISREDLLHFFIIGQGTNYSFLSSGDSEQKNIISRLTDRKSVV
jgi:DNA repair exonuclease SbcCD ATPase subunit